MRCGSGLWAGLGAALVLAAGCARTADDSPDAVVEPPANRMPSIGAEVSLAPQTPKPAQSILPLADIPEPNSFVIEEVREKSPDGALTLRQVKRFSAGLRVNHGRYTESLPDGSKYSQGQYEDGLRTGPWIFWHADGRVAKSGSYKNGKPDGVWTYWRDKDSIAPAVGSQPEREGSTKQRVETYAEGKRNGVWLYYHPNGRISKQEEYRDGRRHGTWIEWYPNGKKQSENHLVDDEVDGLQRLWDRNGRLLRQTEFKRGKRDGHFVSWNDQGEKLSELVYRDDVLVRSIE